MNEAADQPERIPGRMLPPASFLRDVASGEAALLAALQAKGVDDKPILRKEAYDPGSFHLSTLSERSEVFRSPTSPGEYSTLFSGFEEGALIVGNAPFQFEFRSEFHTELSLAIHLERTLQKAVYLFSDLGAFSRARSFFSRLVDEANRRGVSIRRRIQLVCGLPTIQGDPPADSYFVGLHRGTRRCVVYDGVDDETGMPSSVFASGTDDAPIWDAFESHFHTTHEAFVRSSSTLFWET